MQTTSITIRDGLTVALAPLSARESMRADAIVGSILGDEAPAGGQAFSFIISKVYSVCAVRLVNDVPVTPLAGGAAFDAVCDRFSLNDLMQLIVAYSDADAVDLGAVKNESSADTSAA